MTETTTLKRLLLALVTVLVVNPVVLLILTGRPLVSVAITAAALVGVQALYRPSGSRLPVAYALNALALVSVFAHGEAVFDARYSEYAPENLYSVEDGYYFNLPYLAERFVDKEYTAHYITNLQGFRVGEGQNRDERVERADWLFVGDSFTQGAQVEFDDLYTTQLYRLFPDKVVVNAGVSGFGIPQEYRYYLDRGRRLQPSTVFLQLSAFNDLMNVAESEAGFTDHLVERSDFVRYLLQDVKYENPPELPLGRWAEPFRPAEAENVSYNVFYTDDDARKRADLQAFVRYLGLFQKAVERDGSRLVVLFIPTKEQVDPRFFEETVEGFGINTDRLDMERPNRLVAEACDALGISLIDLLVPFKASTAPPFFDYDEHMSPHGHRLMAASIAEAVRSGRVAGLETTSAAPEMLSRDLASDRYPVEYASGGLVSYQTVLDGNTEIVLADSAFEDLQRLTVDDVDQAHPMLSPDLSRVVFTEGDAETMETRVVEMGVAGMGRRVISGGDGAFGAIPVYSPDGRSLAYAAWERDGAGGYTLPRIVVLDLETGTRTGASPEGEEAWRPAVSVSGAVAYIKRVDGQFDVFLRPPGTGRETRLTETPYDEWDPSFSPDGGTLAYAAQADGNWDLFAVAAQEGAEPTRLTRSIGDEWDPSFSPDGRSLLYAGHFGTMKGIYRLPLAAGAASAPGLGR